MTRQKNGSGRDWYDGAAARCSIQDHSEDDTPTSAPSLTLMHDKAPDTNEVTPTDALPPPNDERETVPPGPDDQAATLALKTMVPPALAPDSYFSEVLQEFREARKDQNKHWEDLPKLLTEQAANAALKASAAVRDAVSASMVDVINRLDRVESTASTTSEKCDAIKGTVDRLQPVVSGHGRDIRALRKEVVALKASYKAEIAKLEDRIKQLEDRQ